jgi:hypothetical protein
MFLGVIGLICAAGVIVLSFYNKSSNELNLTLAAVVGGITGLLNQKPNH